MTCKMYYFQVIYQVFFFELKNTTTTIIITIKEKQHTIIKLSICCVRILYGKLFFSFYENIFFYDFYLFEVVTNTLLSVPTVLLFSFLVKKNVL